LVKALASGSTLLDGERLLSKDTKIGYFAQHQLDLLKPEQSPIDHLRMYAPKDRELEQRNYLGRFGFSGERIFEPVAPFSGGEKARLVLALIIRQQPNLLLLDEPTNHLDLEMRQALSVALIEYSGALVVISHDRHLLRSVCDELLIVHDGIVDRFDRRGRAADQVTQQETTAARAGQSS
jgi:ATP-binding cassette subfamily F protein 3